MLKAYLYPGFLKHMINHLIGWVILGMLSYLSIYYPNYLGIKQEYNVFGNVFDFISFSLFLIVLLFALVQAHRSYLLYIPSTYLHFGSTGISFIQLQKMKYQISWEDIHIIELLIEDKGLLSLIFKLKSGDNIKVQLTHYWFYAYHKRKCICYNFNTLVSIVSVYPGFKFKVNKDQWDQLSSFCNY